MKISKYRLHFFKRRFMSLLEVLIALGLAVILLTTMSYFYQDLESVNSEMEKVQRESFQLSYLQNRLAAILPKAISPRGAQKDFFFFTSSDANGLLKDREPSLVFSYDNGVSLDPHLSNHVLGRLYLDKNNNFCLTTWPAPSLWKIFASLPSKKEVLLEGVENLSFKFYNPPERDRASVLSAAKRNNKSLVEITPKDEWLSEWKSEYQQLPAMVKITLKMQGNKAERMFVFPLPNSSLIIVYDR